MKQYNIIYADPPWKYQGGQNMRGSPSKHYPVMPLDEICALPVSKFAAENCALFLWVTFPKLEECFDVIKAWGFTYRTVAFTWIKQTKKSGKWFMGLGWWTRNNAEICLLATKGKPKRVSACVRELVVSPVEQHSKKPDIVTVVLDGQTLQFPTQDPVIKNDSTLVPMRTIFEALNAEVEWVDENGVQQIIAKTADKTITMTINSKEFYVNGEKQPELNEPAQLMNDKTMVPLRAVSESLDCTVEWDQETKTVIIQSKK